MATQEMKLTFVQNFLLYRRKCTVASQSFVVLMLARKIYPMHPQVSLANCWRQTLQSGQRKRKSFVKKQIYPWRKVNRYGEKLKIDTNLNSPTKLKLPQISSKILLRFVCSVRMRIHSAPLQTSSRKDWKLILLYWERLLVIVKKRCSSHPGIVLMIKQFTLRRYKIRALIVPFSGFWDIRSYIRIYRLQSHNS